MERWSGRVALVTGANSGIGASLTHLLVQSGMKVVAADINIDNLEKYGNVLNGNKGRLMTVKCDLTKDEEIYSMFKAIDANFGGVDICVNNAGLSYNKNLLDGVPSEWRHMMNVNVIALCLCTKLAVDLMKERGVDDGHIINLCSVRGHAVYPNERFYTSTKWAVRALTEALRQELREERSHIRVSCISPGKVRTGFAKNLFKDEPEKAEKCYTDCIPLESFDIASSIMHVISAPPHVEINDMIVRPTDKK